MTRQVLVDTEVLGRLRWGLESLRRLAQFDSDLPEQDNPHGLVWRRSDASKAIAYLSEAITLAQAQADQQARLRGLVGMWERRTEQCIEQAEKAGSPMQRESWISTEIATRNCADELKAVLGGKE